MGSLKVGASSWRPIGSVGVEVGCEVEVEGVSGEVMGAGIAIAGMPARLAVTV